MLPSDHDNRMLRARQSLEGLAVGDSFGHRFFFPNAFPAIPGIGRVLPTEPWYYSDDTVMGLGVAAVLNAVGEIDSDLLAVEFARRFARDPQRGYGNGAVEILSAICDGVAWKEAAGAVFGGQGSKGNGAAMRAAPIGAYFAEEEEKVIEQAYRSAEVTHAHKEGQVGAAAVALAAAFACMWASSGRRDGSSLLAFVCERLPKSRVRDGLIEALGLSESTPAADAARKLGCGHQVLAEDTVPFSIWCAWKYRNDFVEGLWQSALAGGDCDTTTAIVGSISILWAGVGAIPGEWTPLREQLPTSLALSGS